MPYIRDLFFDDGLLLLAKQGYILYDAIRSDFRDDIICPYWNDLVSNYFVVADFPDGSGGTVKAIKRNAASESGYILMSPTSISYLSTNISLIEVGFRMGSSHTGGQHLELKFNGTNDIDIYFQPEHSNSRVVVSGTTYSLPISWYQYVSGKLSEVQIQKNFSNVDVSWRVGGTGSWTLLGSKAYSDTYTLEISGNSTYHGLDYIYMYGSGEIEWKYISDENLDDNFLGLRIGKQIRSNSDMIKMWNGINSLY